MIVKKDGRRELFDPTKLRSGVIKACEKRSVSIEQIDSLIQRIEQQLGQLEEKEVSSRYVGELLMKGLRELDQVAYVRFASVYREFSDVSQFLETLSGLLDTKEKLGRRPIKDVPKARSQSRTSRSKKRSLPARGSKHLSKT
jgi:transcriptional repressor NrdR